MFSMIMDSEITNAHQLKTNSGMFGEQGHFINMQPSEAEAGFDIRIPPFADTQSLERRIAEEWAPAYRNLTYKVSTYLAWAVIIQYF